MKDVFKRIINLALFTIYIYAAFYVNMNVEGVKVVVPAECPSCLCINVPTCGDVVVVERGAPFVNKRYLSDSENVEEPYLSRYGAEEDNRQFPLAYAGNTFIVSIVFFVMYKVINSKMRVSK